MYIQKMSGEGYCKSRTTTHSPVARRLAAQIGDLLRHKMVALSLPQRAYIAERLREYADILTQGG